MLNVLSEDTEKRTDVMNMLYYHNRHKWYSVCWSQNILNTSELKSSSLHKSGTKGLKYCGQAQYRYQVVFQIVFSCLPHWYEWWIIVTEFARAPLLPDGPPPPQTWVCLLKIQAWKRRKRMELNPLAPVPELIQVVVSLLSMWEVVGLIPVFSKGTYTPVLTLAKLRHEQKKNM